MQISADAMQDLVFTEPISGLDPVPQLALARLAPVAVGSRTCVRWLIGADSFVSHHDVCRANVQRQIIVTAGVLEMSSTLVNGLLHRGSRGLGQQPGSEGGL